MMHYRRGGVPLDDRTRRCLACASGRRLPRAQRLQGCRLPCLLRAALGAALQPSDERNALRAERLAMIACLSRCRRQRSAATGRVADWQNMQVRDGKMALDRVAPPSVRQKGDLKTRG